MAKITKYMKKIYKIAINPVLINPHNLKSAIEELKSLGVFNEDAMEIRYDDSDKTIEASVLSILDRYFK